MPAGEEAERLMVYETAQRPDLVDMYNTPPTTTPGRCPSTQGHYRCVGMEEHAGVHWAPVGKGVAVRWGVVEVGCADPGCKREPDHPLPHRDTRGTFWWPADDFECRFEVAFRR